MNLQVTPELITELPDILEEIEGEQIVSARQKQETAAQPPMAQPADKKTDSGTNKRKSVKVDVASTFIQMKHDKESSPLKMRAATENTGLNKNLPNTNTLWDDDLIV